MADRLARHASTDDIDSPLVGTAQRERPHVAPPLNVRPMLGEHATGVVVDLDLPPALHASTLEPKVEATDASEEGAEGHASHS